MAGWKSFDIFCVLRLNKVVTEIRVKLDDAVLSFMLPMHAGDFLTLPFLLKRMLVNHSCCFRETWRFFL